MANEIVVLDGDSKGRKNLLFWYSIPSGQQLEVGSTGQKVVSCPSADLPAPADIVMPQGKKDALDAGTALYTVLSNVDLRGLTNAQATARIRALYNDSTYQTLVLDNYKNRYQNYGLVLDA